MNASNEPTSMYTEPQAGGLIDFQWLGRKYIGFEIDKKYFDYSKTKLYQQTLI